MGDLILTERDGAVGMVTLNRPERHNSLVPELLRDLSRALHAWRSEPELRALILQANGRSFSTGGDIRGFFDHRDDIQAYAREVVGLLNETILALVAFPVPVVTAVHGIVTGGSLGLVLASDIVLIAPEATLTAYYTAVGFSPDGGWTAMLPAVVGHTRAAEALLLDRPITATQAVEWGLASRIVPADRIHKEARAVADELAGRRRESIVHAKRLLWDNADGLVQKLERERRRFVRQIASHEAQEGMAAFLRRTNHS